ncbi:hypothetical protein I4U23_030500 [Adineta vaga]|nr:hypothetical protein I4U23_030500 [Adineta vaga]
MQHSQASTPYMYPTSPTPNLPLYDSAYSSFGYSSPAPTSSSSSFHFSSCPYSNESYYMPSQYPLYYSPTAYSMPQYSEPFASSTPIQSSNVCLASSIKNVQQKRRRPQPNTSSPSLCPSRKRISDEAIDHLNAFYSMKKRPTEAEKDRLATECNITVAQVNTWFNNARSRRGDTNPKLAQKETIRLSSVWRMIIIDIISGEPYQNNIADFFYNVNFAGPIFDQPVYYINTNVSVATPNGTSVLRFTVRKRTDNDRPSFIYTNVTVRNLNSRIDTLEVISDDSHFVVDRSSDGDDNYTLSTNTYPLNYSRPFHRYLFRLIAKQYFTDRPAVTSTAIVQIHLINANVHKPIFVNDKQVFYISEAALPGTKFGTIYATDADNDPILYFMQPSTLFSIDQHTGVLQLDQPFDYSPEKTNISINVTITNSLQEEPNNSTSFIINIISVNRHSPVFSGSVCGSNIFLREDAELGQVVTILNVIDKDRGANGQIDISFPSEHLRTAVSGLKNTAYSSFYIEQMNQTGMIRQAMIKTNSKFDYNGPSADRVWHLFIIATDRGKPQRQALCTLRIDLIDINNNAPKFIMTSWNFTIYPSTVLRNNTLPFRIIASDADSGLNAKINYYIGTLHVPYFTINWKTGYIGLRSGISDLQSLNKSDFPIQFQVYARDSGTPPLFSVNNATVIIDFKNDNEQSPATWFDSSYEELNIRISEKFYENSSDRIVRDEKFNGEILYNLSASLPSIMTVSNPFVSNAYLPFRDKYVKREESTFHSSIVVTSGLHAEIQHTYLLYTRVLVNPPLIGLITIDIKDENDQIPTFDIRSIVLSVDENERGNRTLAKIQAFDRDIEPENNAIEYYLNQNLSDKEANNIFHVESDGTLWTNTTFGEESTMKAFYRLFITATNLKPAWDTTSSIAEDFQIDIQVISVNRSPPVFITNVTMIDISINETTANGTVIYKLNITDEDIDAKLNVGILDGNIHNAFTFTIFSDNSDDEARSQYEAIVQLKIVAPLDYESISIYHLRLFAFDAKNRVDINVTVRLQVENTKAPYFKIMPGFNSYHYSVTENSSYKILYGAPIKAIDPDIPPTSLRYEIYDTNHQLNLGNVFLTGVDNEAIISINSTGLSRDVPFGSAEYKFAIRATDENGTGVSSYASVIIKVIDINNNAPIPINSPWYINEGINPSTIIVFEDYDDHELNHTFPFTVEILQPLNVTITRRLDSNTSYDLVYNGVLNCTETKYLIVTINASDVQGVSKITKISIKVRGNQTSDYAISAGTKTIEIIYVDGYQNSIRNTELGSVYVNGLNSCAQDDRTCSIDNVSNGKNFSVLNCSLMTSDVLDPGFLTVKVNVIKPNTQIALSTMELNIGSVKSEKVQEAATIRIKGKDPEELIVPSNQNSLYHALASILRVNRYFIQIFSIRSVFQYQSPFVIPKPIEEQKANALIDVVFYVRGWNKVDVEKKLHENLAKFQTDYNIEVVASGPNPCHNYHCVSNTICRPSRTIGLKPKLIDTNQTSFLGINILDSADCVNEFYNPTFPNTSRRCFLTAFDSLNGSLASLSSTPYGPIGPCSEILGRTFHANGQGYAIYNGSTFSNFHPTRLSFDFILQAPLNDCLILLYGRNAIEINDFFWMAVDIFQSTLRFHFRGAIQNAVGFNLTTSTWYHIEYQILESDIHFSINDYHYNRSINTTYNTYDLSTVQLYLGSLPNLLSTNFSYPSLDITSGFRGCIRNVLSNGYYLNMSNSVSSNYSTIGECPNSITDPNYRIDNRRSLVPWYTWLIIALILLFLTILLTIILLTLIRRRLHSRALCGLYSDDTRDNIIDYKDTAGEQDHSTYNLHILKKPIYALTDGSIIPNRDRLNNSDQIFSHRPSLGNYIEEKLDEQHVRHVYDTRLHYHDEGVGSIAGDLSSIESSSIQDEIDYRYLSSLGPKFSRLSAIYARDSDMNDNI